MINIQLVKQDTKFSVNEIAYTALIGRVLGCRVVYFIPAVSRCNTTTEVGPSGIFIFRTGRAVIT